MGLTRKVSKPEIKRWRQLHKPKELGGSGMSIASIARQTGRAASTISIKIAGKVKGKPKVVLTGKAKLPPFLDHLVKSGYVRTHA